MTSEQLYDMIDKDPVYFERTMLTRIMLDAQFATLVGTVLFCDHEGQEARSFQMPRHAGLAQAALLYHLHGGPVTPQPSWEFLHTCMSQVAGQGKLPAQELTDVWQYFYEMLCSGSTNMPLIQQQTNTGCTYWLKQVRTQMISQRARTERWRADKLQGHLRQENVFIDKLANTEQMIFDIWEELQNPKPDVVRLRTSIAQLNVRLGGGFGRGEGYLFIAASGAGKTVTSTQFAGEWALAGNKVALVTTERSQATNDLTMRLLSQQCGIPYKQIVNGLNQGTLQPTQRAAVEEFSRHVNKGNFRIVEWFKRPNRDIRLGLRDTLDQLANEMGGLDAFLLDWIGGSLDDDAKNDPTKIRLAYNGGCEAVADLAGDMNAVGCTFAQAHNVTGKNNARVGAANLQESKSMDKPMTGVIGISAIQSKDQDEAGHGENYEPDQYFFIGKARKGVGGLVPVRRNFGYQKFVDRMFRQA
jgi:hypothetical protein